MTLTDSEGAFDGASRAFVRAVDEPATPRSREPCSTEVPEPNMRASLTTGVESSAMKTAALTLFLIPLLLAGCASSPPDDPNAPNVTVHLDQYEMAPGAFQFGGSVNVRFAMSITNATKDPVKLNRVEIRTVGSGAYTIPTTSTPMNIDLGPGEAKTMTLSLWGRSRGGQLAAQEPVSIRGLAYLTGPKGTFLRLFTEYITPQ